MKANDQQFVFIKEQMKINGDGKQTQLEAEN